MVPHWCVRWWETQPGIMAPHWCVRWWANQARRIPPHWCVRWWATQARENGSPLMCKVMNHSSEGEWLPTDVWGDEPLKPGRMALHWCVRLWATQARRMAPHWCVRWWATQARETGSKGTQKPFKNGRVVSNHSLAYAPGLSTPVYPSGILRNPPCTVIPRLPKVTFTRCVHPI